MWTPKGAVCSGSTLFASILNSSVMLGNYLQQTTKADDIFRFHIYILRNVINANCTIEFHIYFEKVIKTISHLQLAILNNSCLSVL